MSSNIPQRIFFGAGMSYTSGLPTATHLLTTAKQTLTLDEIGHGAQSVWELADHCEKRKNLYNSFKKCVAETLTTTTYNITPEYKMLSFLISRGDIKAAYTTNQDTLLEYCLEKQGIPYNRYTHKSKTYTENMNGHFDVIKVCGDIHDPQDMCFSQKEIRAVVKDTVPVFAHLIKLIGEGVPFIFLGYSFHNDALGEALSGAVSGKKDNLIVDAYINERQLALTMEGNAHVQLTAERFFEDKIRRNRPALRVKHILYNVGGVGGVQTYYHSLKELCEGKEPQMAFSACGIEDYYKDEAKKGDQDNSFGFTYLRAAAMSRTYECAAEGGFDVIHAHDFISAYMAVELGLPVIYTSHSLESQEIKLLGQTEKRRERIKFDDAERYEGIYYPAIPHILSLSDSHIQSLPGSVRHSVVKTPAPFIMPEKGAAIALKPMPVDGGDKNEFKKGRFTVAYFGRATYRKGIDILNQALNSIAQKDFQVLFVGPELTADGDMVKVVMEKTASGAASHELYVDEFKSEFTNRVYSLKLDVGDGDFREHLAELWAAYELADVVVIPSRYEPYGYVALEALAMKKPVIAADVGGLSEILDCGRGLLVDINEGHEALANAIVQAIDNADGMRVMAMEGYNWVKEKYTERETEKVAARMYDLYLSAIIYGNKHTLDVGGRSYDELRNQFSSVLYAKNGWKEILLAAAKEYRHIRYGMPADEEYYDLYWEIARWVKQLKPLCPEVSMISQKNLAELITQVERLLPR